jgi:protein involved in polysaccharide export with SLBB domain
MVDVSGEVLYPGAYPIEAGETRLSDIIEAAGGLTAEASLRAARITRPLSGAVEDKEFERLKKLSRSEMTDQEYAYLRMKSRGHPGKMVVDFEKALLEGDPDEDILLHRGDRINIPSARTHVTVLGTVYEPGNITYRPGLTARDYVDFAGGYTKDADKGKSRVIKVTGEAWVTFGEAGALEPGDVVLVPQKDPPDYFRYFTTGLTITLQILTIWLIVDRAIEP